MPAWCARSTLSEINAARSTVPSIAPASIAIKPTSSVMRVLSDGESGSRRSSAFSGPLNCTRAPLVAVPWVVIMEPISFGGVAK